jgi:hypothetical protein
MITEKSTRMTGTDGHMDYVVVGTTDGVTLGIKVWEGAQIKAPVVVSDPKMGALCIRIRVDGKTSGKTGQECATTIRGPWNKGGPHHASASLVIPVSFEGFMDADLVLDAINKTGWSLKISEMLTAGLQPHERVVSEADLVEYLNTQMRGMVEKGLATYVEAVEASQTGLDLKATYDQLAKFGVSSGPVAE